MKFVWVGVAAPLALDADSATAEATVRDDVEVSIVVGAAEVVLGIADTVELGEAEVGEVELAAEVEVLKIDDDADDDAALESATENSALSAVQEAHERSVVSPL